MFIPLVFLTDADARANGSLCEGIGEEYPESLDVAITWFAGLVQSLCLVVPQTFKHRVGGRGDPEKEVNFQFCVSLCSVEKVAFAAGSRGSKKGVCVVLVELQERRVVVESKRVRRERRGRMRERAEEWCDGTWNDWRSAGLASWDALRAPSSPPATILECLRVSARTTALLSWLGTLSLAWRCAAGPAQTRHQAE